MEKFGATSIVRFFFGHCRCRKDGCIYYMLLCCEFINCLFSEHVLVNWFTLVVLSHGVEIKGNDASEMRIGYRIQIPRHVFYPARGLFCGMNLYKSILMWAAGSNLACIIVAVVYMPTFLTGYLFVLKLTYSVAVVKPFKLMVFT